MTAFLWAQDRDGLIGKDGHLPWHLPDDLHYFRAQTVGKIMVVGRRTYESFPKRPLPERTNVVLTHQEDYQAPGAVVVHDVAAVLLMLSSIPIRNWSLLVVRRSLRRLEMMSIRYW